MRVGLRSLRCMNIKTKPSHTWNQDRKWLFQTSLACGFICIVREFSVMCYIYIPATTPCYLQPQRHSWVSSVDSAQLDSVLLSSQGRDLLIFIVCVLFLIWINCPEVTAVFQKPWIKQTQNRCAFSLRESDFLLFGFCDFRRIFGLKNKHGNKGRHTFDKSSKATAHAHTLQALSLRIIDHFVNT